MKLSAIDLLSNFCILSNHKNFINRSINFDISRDIKLINSLNKQLYFDKKYWFFEADKEILSESAKKKVIFVSERWCGCNPNLGETNSFHNIFESLAFSDLAIQSRFFYDAYYHMNQTPGDEALFSLCNLLQPNLLILCWHPYYEYNIKLETLKRISNETKISIKAIWYDSVVPRIFQEAESLVDIVDLNLILDTNTVHKKYFTKHPEKYLPLWTPQSPKYFYNNNKQKTYNVSFWGSIYPSRKKYINLLLNSGINVDYGGGQRSSSALSIESYAEKMRNSKIVLNFCQSGEHYVQTKGRIFEALLCGALLFEEANTEIIYWLNPMEDFVPFFDGDDLLDKIIFFWTIQIF